MDPHEHPQEQIQKQQHKQLEETQPLPAHTAGDSNSSGLQLLVCAVLLLATVGFVAWRRPGPALITAIASVAYFAMQRALAANAGGQQQPQPLLLGARYADWLLTTPLILYLLLKDSLSPAWLALVCGADALMIVAGYLGATVEATVQGRRAWFALSFAFFVPVLAAVAHKLGSRAHGRAAAALVLAIWPAYPVLWWAQYCRADAAAGLSPAQANAWTAALDVVAKVGFGILL